MVNSQTASLNRCDAAQRPNANEATLRSREFLTPTLVSIGIEISSVVFLIGLLLLITLRSGDGGNDSGGSGNGSSGDGGLGEFSATGSGSGTANDRSSSAIASPGSSQTAALQDAAGNSVSSEPSGVASQSPTSPLSPPEKKSNVFVVQDLPKQAAAVAPQGVGGGDGFSDLGDRLEKAGARTGDVQISLAWNNGNDLDLHVETPGSETIWYNHRNSTCGGELDVDMNAGGPASQRPVENVYWPAGGSPSGKFRVLVHYYANHGGRDPTRFQVTIKVKDQTENFSGSLRPGDQPKLVHEFSFP